MAFQVATKSFADVLICFFLAIQSIQRKALHAKSFYRNRHQAGILTQAEATRNTSMLRTFLQDLICRLERLAILLVLVEFLKLSAAFKSNGKDCNAPEAT